MQSRTVITITTDFGIGSPYIAEMKGAILSVNANVQLVDVTHSIEPQNVLQGALCLRQFVHAFPEGSVHVAVVDPGVGTDRRILLVEAKGQHFVAPDNGLLTFVLNNATSIRVVDNDSFWRDHVTATFHGRDIMGPVAAHLSNGVPAEQLASESNLDPIKLAFEEPVITPSLDGTQRIQGQVIMIDSFGNLISNVHEKLLPSHELCVEYQSKHWSFVKTYGVADVGDFVALIGSSGWLELAVRSGNAAEQQNAKVGDPVVIVARSG